MIIATDQIQCPECRTIQKGDVTVETGHPWQTYIHECEGCGYMIMESEWQDWSCVACQKAVKEAVMQKQITLKDDISILEEELQYYNKLYGMIVTKEHPERVMGKTFQTRRT